MRYSCYGCERRTVGCHATCPEYQAERERKKHGDRRRMSDSLADDYEQKNFYFRMRTSGGFRKR